MTNSTQGRTRRRIARHDHDPARRLEPLGLAPRMEAIAEGPAKAGILSRERLYRVALVLGDATVAAAVLVAVVLLISPATLEPVTFLTVPLLVAMNKLAGLYDRDELVLKKSTLDELPTLVQMGGLFALIAWLLHSELSSANLRPAHVLLVWAGTVVLLAVARVVARRLAHELAPTERCLLIGEQEAVAGVERKLRSARVDAAVVAALPLRPGMSIDADTFAEVVRELDVHRVVIAPLSIDASEVLELIRIAKGAGVRVSVLPRLMEVVGSAVEFDELDGLIVLGVRRFGLSRSSRALKRGFDLVGASLAVLALAPLLAAIALAIRLERPGPVFFRQVRVGRDGRRFHMLKFRSMEPDAEARKEDLRHLNEAGSLFKIAADPRVTRVGRVLRKASLDELPQLFNVLRGEMSLVGPRPLVVDEDARIEGMFRSRLHLTPGMTGHWQILGSARVPLQEMIGIDYLYVANWSLWTDLKILLRTVPYLLTRQGV